MNELLRQVVRIEDLMARRPYASHSKSVRFVVGNEQPEVGPSGEPLVYRRVGIQGTGDAVRHIGELDELGSYDESRKYIKVQELENVLLPVGLFDVVVTPDGVWGITVEGIIERGRNYALECDNVEKRRLQDLRKIREEGVEPLDNLPHSQYPEVDFWAPYRELSPAVVNLIVFNLGRLERSMVETKGPVVKVDGVMQIR